ncbi:MAG: ABC transporter permease [Bdellovibrionaceae bacterium]|nr:ABC transporter permease [Pseudobdellovibrionaceae bacterium]
MNVLVREAEELFKFRWVTFSIVRSTILLRYRRSLLGFLWSLLNPILNYIVVGSVFYLLSRGNTENYFIFMFTGSAIFNLISTSANQSPHIMIGNEHYIKKIYLPKTIFVLNSILLEFVNFVFSLVALLLLGIAFGRIPISYSLVSLPIVVSFVVLFNFGVAALISVAAVFFRDLIHIVPICTQAAFFATPILYDVSLIPPKYQDLVVYNPFYHFVRCFREPLYSGQLASPLNYCVLIFGAVVVFILGFWVLKYNENRIVFRL